MDKFFTTTARKECYSCRPHPKQGVLGEVLSLVREATYQKVAKDVGVSTSTIYEWIKNFGESPGSGSHNKRVTECLDIDQNWMDGWLLGDGCLSRGRGKRFPCCKHGSSKQGYTKYVVKKWREMGFEAKLGKPYIKRDGKVAYHAWTRSYPGLLGFYNRWYPEGKKRLPDRLDLTREGLLQWFLGDGSFSCGAPSIVLCAFTEEEVQRLLKMVENLVYAPRLNEGNKGLSSHYWKFRWSSKRAVEFFDCIGDCPVEEYQYRWPLQ